MKYDVIGKINNKLYPDKFDGTSYYPSTITCVYTHIMHVLRDRDFWDLLAYNMDKD